MKVLLVTTLDTGGAGKACVRLHLSLLEKGIQSKLLLLYRKDKDIPESYTLYESNPLLFSYKKALKKLTNKKYLIRNKPKGYEGFSFPYTVHRIDKHPLYDWADIINLHWVALFLDYPTFFKNNNKKIIWTLHDMLPFSGGYHYEEGFPIKSYTKIVQRYETLKQRVLQNQHLTIVALCHWMCNKSKQSKAFKGFNHTIIPNGIDAEIYKPIDSKVAKEIFNLPTNKKLLLFVSESIHNQRKGFSILQEALAKLSPKDDFVLGVLGNGTINLKNTSIPIYNLGFINDERLISVAYSAADLFVTPAIEDNLPNTIIESIMCGTPVASFEIGGIPEIITPNLNGIMSQKIDAKNLSKLLEKAMNIDFVKNDIRQNAVSRFHKTIQADNYIQLFQKTQNIK